MLGQSDEHAVLQRRQIERRALVEEKRDGDLMTPPQQMSRHGDHALVPVVGLIIHGALYRAPWALPRSCRQRPSFS